MIKALRLALGPTYSRIKSEQNSQHYLQKLTVRFYWIIMEPTQRSGNNFGFLIGVLDGSGVSFWFRGIGSNLYRLLPK